jgi:hypothetical protein
MRVLAGVGLLALAFAVPARAETLIEAFSGQGMIQGCRAATDPRDTYAKEDGYEVGRCIGVVYALFQAAVRDGRVCSDKPIIFEQVIQATARYLDHHPQDLKKGIGELTFTAISELWPCGKMKKNSCMSYRRGR